MTMEKLIFIDDGFDRRQFPDLVPLGLAGIVVHLATAPAAAFGIASRDGDALLAGDKFSEAPFVALLSALLSILSRQRLSLGFGVRMFGAGRQRGISRGEFLNLVGERSDLLLELVDTFLITSHQSFDEITCRLGFRR